MRLKFEISLPPGNLDIRRGIFVETAQRVTGFDYQNLCLESGRLD